MGERWVVLLRGVNVGGSHRLAMSDLRDTCSSLGFTAVQTYIQSGNVVLESDGLHESDVASKVRGGLADRHGLDVPVVVRAAAEWQRLGAAHPGDGGDLDPKFLHVWCLDRAPDQKLVAAFDSSRFVPDTWTIDGREMFVTYPQGSARSKLTIDVVERAFGVTATGRNLNTVRRLGAMAATG